VTQLLFTYVLQVLSLAEKIKSIEPDLRRRQSTPSFIAQQIKILLMNIMMHKREEMIGC
jgi:hypothetical protein